MIVFPKSKINLGLRITRRRDDGFHDIETIFYPIGLTDALEFVTAGKGTVIDSLVVTGADPGGSPDDNLVIRAAKKIREIKPFPFLRIHLHKVIPTGAGLGGGSSDAAFLLKGINRYYNLQLEDHVLKSAALELGSDCPFFIDSVPSFATGRGEIMQPAEKSAEGLYLALFNPGVGINTREAYQNCRPALPSTSLNEIIKLPLADWKNLIFNDFEEYAFRKHPVIKEIKDELYKCGADFSLMSGSGSSVYGIFSKKPRIPDHLKKYLIWEGLL